MGGSWDEEPNPPAPVPEVPGRPAGVIINKDYSTEVAGFGSVILPL